MGFISPRLLLRVTHPCHPVGRAFEGTFPPLGPAYFLDNLAALNGLTNFADLAVGWNHQGLYFHLVVSEKSLDPCGDPNRIPESDGLTLWIDTKCNRSLHRANAFCHQFHFLPAGGGTELKDELFVQGQIKGATENAPLISPKGVAFRTRRFRKGYEIEAFLSADALHGFHPETHPDLGFYYRVMDRQLGEQLLLAGVEAPSTWDPTVWETLRLVQ